MMDQSFSAQLDALKKNFASAGINLNTALGKGLTNAALIVEADYKTRLRVGGQVASGLLYASASHRLIETDGYPVAQIGPAVDYGKEVELGGPPRDVPYEDILKWIQDKHMVSGSGKSGRKVKSDTEAEASLAFLIQRSIKEKGTMPHPALLPALLANQDEILSAISNQLKSALVTGAQNAS